MATIPKNAALELMYRSSTIGAPTAEFDRLGGYAAVKAAAEAAGYGATPEFIQSYEIANNLPESASTKLNKQFIGSGGAAKMAQLETDLTSKDAALAAQTRANLAAQSAAANQQAAAEAAQRATTYTPAQIANAINVSRQQGFNEADIATGLGRFLPNAAAVTSALAANPKASPVIPTTPSAITPITRPPAPAQPSYTQLAPASVTNTAITGTPYTNVYTPATMQQNAPTLAQINAASQSANPYQSLMALTPQRTISPAYSGMLGQTAANTNLGGYNPAIYNPAATTTAATTGLLNTTGGGGGVGPGGAEGGIKGGGGGIPGLNIDPLAYGMARVANLFTSPVSLNTAPVTTATFNPTQNTAQQSFRAGELATQGVTGLLGGGQISPFENAYATAISNAKMDAAAMKAADAARYGSQIAATAANVQAAQNAADAAAIANANSAGYDGNMGNFGGGSNSFGEGQYAKGGMVNMNPQMHNPPGPDDGYAALDNGEYVIRKSAVKKYGSNIFEQINAGKIPAQRLKSLLE